MEKSEFRLLIKHCFLMGKNTVQEKEWLEKCYPSSAPSRQIVENWFVDFKRGCTNTDDAERYGRSNSTVVPGKKRPQNGFSQSLIEIAWDSWHHLRYQKTVYSLFCMNIWAWVARAAKGENRPKRPKTQMSAGKVLASVFRYARCILFIDHLEKERTINSEYYMALLERLKKEIAETRPQMKKRKMLFHQGNAPCHKSIATMAKLQELHSKLLLHPPYSPDPVNQYSPASGCQQLLPVCRHKKNAPGEEIWLQWWRDCRNKSVFWGHR